MNLKENATLLAIIATLGFRTFSFLVARVGDLCGSYFMGWWYYRPRNLPAIISAY